jgi:hypothetical protein
VKILKFKPAVTEEECKRRQKRHAGNLMAVLLALALVRAFSGVKVSPSELAFPSLPVGSATEPEKIRLTNRGTADVSFYRFEVQGKSADSFAVKHDACDRLASGASCALLVEFHPSEPRANQARLVISASNGEELTAELAGMGVVASVTVKPGEISFGEVTVGQSSAQQVEVEGEGWFHVHNVALVGRGAGQFRADKGSCLDNTRSVKRCTIAVTFQPDAKGTWQAQLSVDDEGAGSPHTVRISGNAVLPAQELASPPPTPVPRPRLVPAIRVEPLTLAFSSVDQKPKPVRVLNEGNAPLHVSASVNGSNPDRFAANLSGCVGDVPAGGECVIVVSYNKKLWKPEPSYSAQLDIPHNAPNAATQSVALRWERQVVPQAHVTVTPSSLTFENGYALYRAAAKRGPQEQTITIHNDGPVALKQLNVRLGFLGGGEKGPFTHSSNCRQLDVGEDCKETVGFVPQEMKQFKETLYVFEGPLGNMATVDLVATALEAPK